MKKITSFIFLTAIVSLNAIAVEYEVGPNLFTAL